MLKNDVVLAIGDMHHPFAHPDTIPFLIAVKKKYRPTVNVCLGDEIDAHALSDYDHDPDGDGAGPEHDKALVQLRKLYKVFPEMFVCTSNHTARPFRKAYKAGLPIRFLKSYSDIMEAPRGWKWADKWIIDDTIYEHGEGHSGANGARQAAMLNMRNTVIGHIHSFAGIQYFANSETLIFGFNVGCLIDNHAYAFKYARTYKPKGIIGVGIIDKGIPQFIPMQMTNKGRWTGNV